MGFAGALLLFGVWVLGQPVFAAFEAPACITAKNGSLEMIEVTEDRLKWAQEGVDAHNKLRKKHGVPPLVLNPELCKSARWIANQNAGTGQLYHTQQIDWVKMDCGENLFATGEDKLMPASEAVNDWYAEIKDYDYSKPVFGMNTGHFTQVVWKGSKEVCMSYEYSEKGTYHYFIAAQYYPPGNYKGEFGENVLGSANDADVKPGTGSANDADVKPRTGSANDVHFKPGIICILILCVHVY